MLVKSPIPQIHASDSSYTTHNLNYALKNTFSKAAARYEQHAHVQKIAADKLSQHISPTLSATDVVLDIGSGTGALADVCSQKAAKWLNLDISLAMLKSSQKQNSSFNVQGDANELPIAGNSMDKVVSNMALQWCPAPTQVMNEILRVLKPGGDAFLCIMLGNSFETLRGAWRRAGYTPRLQKLPSSSDWLTTNHAGQLKFYREDEHVDEAQSFIDLLKRIKNVGASHYDAKAGVLTKQEINDVSNAWKKQNGNVFKLEYRLLTMHIHKDKG